MMGFADSCGWQEFPYLYKVQTLNCFPDPQYKPNYDIIYDTAIDMKDTSFVAQRFGQEDP